MAITDTTSSANRLASALGDALRLGTDPCFADDLEIELDEGATLIIGDRVSIRHGTTLQVNRNAIMVIEDDVAIWEHVFLSAMVGIRIGAGVGISNMVDIHDHNHRERSVAHAPDGELAPWASGFEGAPVIVECGAVLSNKVTITAGVRIGQNSLIGANSVVTRSIPPNTVALGVPAAPARSFDGRLNPAEPAHLLRIAWFGTSIMEHFEGFNTQLINQAALPPIGSSVVVEGWRQRGYVQRLQLSLQTAWPFLRFDWDNRGEGGATSRDILRVVREGTAGGRNDLAFLGCGINDVWRGFQQRDTEAVGIDEYADNYRTMVRLLREGARKVVCIAETPFGWDADLDVVPMNAELVRYNAVAERIARDEGADFIDVWPAFTTTASQFAVGGPAAGPSETLWSDGVHLSELGDALMLRQVERHLAERGVISVLATYERHERSRACADYRWLFTDARDAVDRRHDNVDVGS